LAAFDGISTIGQFPILLLNLEPLAGIIKPTSTDETLESNRHSPDGSENTIQQESSVDGEPKDTTNTSQDTSLPLTILPDSVSDEILTFLQPTQHSTVTFLNTNEAFTDDLHSSAPPVLEDQSTAVDTDNSLSSAAESKQPQRPILPYSSLFIFSQTNP